MHISRSLLTADLHRHLAALGSDLGQMSISVYDTAQVMRLAPPRPHQLWPVLEWLIAQQQDDGAWNAMSMNERERTAPTLAATLVLHLYATRHRTQEAVVNGLHWLQRSLPAWAEPLPDDLPVGVELIVPHLVSAAISVGLDVPVAYADRLAALRARRLAQLEALPPAVVLRSTAMHSWEAWGADPLFVTPQAEIGICASPAATAAWIAQATAHGLPEAQIGPARIYLERATAAASDEISGLYPTAWPISHFEMAYALHTVVQSGLHRSLDIESSVAEHLDTLASLIAAGGVGATGGFPPDGDDTAAAIGALHAFGRQPGLDALSPFLNYDHAVSYVGELQPSVITTARAAQVIAEQGGDCTALLGWLARRQELHGLWPTDKWNADRRYVAAQVILALAGSPAHMQAVLRARDGLLAFQKGDGGWGLREGQSQRDSTAYAVMGLLALPAAARDSGVQGALERARRWMAWNYRPFSASDERHWLAKDRYRPHRLGQVIELSTFLALVLDYEQGKP